MDAQRSVASKSINNIAVVGWTKVEVSGVLTDKLQDYTILSKLTTGCLYLSIYLLTFVRFVYIYFLVVRPSHSLVSMCVCVNKKDIEVKSVSM